MMETVGFCRNIKTECVILITVFYRIIYCGRKVSVYRRNLRPPSSRKNAEEEYFYCDNPS